MNHNWRFKWYVPTTAKEIITDTVRFIPKKMNLPIQAFVNKQKMIPTLNKIPTANHQQPFQTLTIPYLPAQAFLHAKNNNLP